MNIRQHRLYYFDYQGTHAPNNAINLEFYDGSKLIFQIKIQIKDHGTIFRLNEKLENGTFSQLDRIELPEYWVKPIFGLEVDENSLTVVDITGSANGKYKLFTVNTMKFDHFNQLKLLCNFPETDYTRWTITAFPLVLENGKEIIFDPNRSRNYSESVKYCNSRNTQIILPESSYEKSNIRDVLREALEVGPLRARVR